MMKQWTHNEFCKMIEKNGFYYARNNGGHSIYKNNKERHISVPTKVNSTIARRLIKENNLKIKLK